MLPRFSLREAGGLCFEGVLGVDADCDDAVRSQHFELHASIARDRHESGESCSS